MTLSMPFALPTAHPAWCWSLAAVAQILSVLISVCYWHAESRSITNSVLFLTRERALRRMRRPLLALVNGAAAIWRLQLVA
jgi:hypothetical protein